MVNDPYGVLGLTPGASNDEVKKAYRELSRKYHPDSYVDNPLSGLAEEKFKEVQEAYDQIMKEREGGYTDAGYSGHGNSGYNSSYTQSQSDSSEDTVQLNAAVNYINSRHYQEAMNILSRMSNRSARWYYCSAAANAGMGNNMEAVNHARQAVNMEPNNPEYTNLLNQLQWTSQRYQSNSYRGGRPAYSTGNFCCDLWCADSCCECMGGDLCPCI